MKGGLTAELVKRLRRADPTVRLIPEITVVASSDEKATRDDYNAADSTTGFDLDHPLGGVRLTGSVTTVVEETSSNATTTDLDGPPQLQGASPFSVARITWGGTETSAMEFTQFVAYLDPDVASTGALVDTWYCQPFALAEVKTGGYLQLYPVTSEASASAGASPGDVTFTFKNPPPKQYGAPRNGAGYGYTFPTTYVFIWAVDANGDPAGNVSWDRDGGTSQVGTTNILTGRQLTLSELGYKEVAGGFTGTPRCAVKKATYSAATITWSTADHVIVGAVTLTPSVAASMQYTDL